VKNGINIINRKSKFEYEFLDSYVCGIVLFGTEVKSIRNGKISLVDSFCMFDNGELILKNVIIDKVTGFSHETNRDRKLLLKKKELKKLSKDLKDGLTIIPFRIFTNENNLIKIEIKLVRGKKLWDKRETIKNRDIDKQIKRIQNGKV
jgi:SsrA-binding protein